MEVKTTKKIETTRTAEFEDSDIVQILQDWAAENIGPAFKDAGVEFDVSSGGMLRGAVMRVRTTETEGE